MMGSSTSQDQPSLPTVVVQVRTQTEGLREYRFQTSFKIGRQDDCDISIKNEFVSRTHLNVALEQGEWWVVDVGSSNGIYVGEQRVLRVALREGLQIRLGIRGPEVTLKLVPAVSPPAPRIKSGRVEDYAQHYFGKSGSQHPAGEHTMLIRSAFAQVQKKEKRKYGGVIVALAVFVVAFGGFAVYQHQQAGKQRAIATDIFYSMKSLDLDIANLQDVVKSSNSQQGIVQLKKIEGRRNQMENSYDHYLSTLNVYNPKMKEQDRLILRVSRIFGECELDMPPDFVSEVDKYIKYWQSSGRLARAIKLANKNGYTTKISKAMLDEGLPPQFFYLALQESDFNPYASGPPTRMGIAKGMWQFIPQTGLKYGLHLGPLVELPRPDVLDERHHYDLETVAAARYLKDLYGSDAQGSGLLVMACYNWGENQVLPLVRSMPADPRERNFWKLLQKHRNQIPKETYDYVFYIMSAAVIGENPRLFGFDFDNPLTVQSNRANAMNP
jgi:membrane-bound lytic murein transglycosylase D